MVQVDKDSYMTGIGTNPSLLIRAPDYVAEGAQVVYDSDYFDQKAVRVTKQGQKIFETGWLKAGTLANNTTPVLYWADGNSGTPLNDRFDSIRIIVYKRFPGETDWTTKDMWFSFANGLSNASGDIAFDKKNLLGAAQYYFFNKNYEYKFVAYVGQITAGAWIDVEALKIQYMQHIGVTGAAQFVLSDQTKNPNTPELVPVIDAYEWTIIPTSGGVIDCILPIYVKDGIGGATSREGVLTSGTGFAPFYSASPGVIGQFSSLDYCETSCMGFSGSTPPTQPMASIPYFVDALDAWTVWVAGKGLPASTQVWFTTVLYGSQLPIEV